jgi:hypothetical protein
VITSSRSNLGTAAPLDDNTQCCVCWEQVEAVKIALTEAAKTAGSAWHGVVVAGDHARRRSGTSGKRRVATKHSNARSIFRTAKGYHVLSDVVTDDLAMLSAATGQDVLNEIVSELITGN